MTKTGQHQRCITALALGAMFVIVVIGTPVAQAQTYTVLHRFRGPPTDGGSPYGNLIVGSAGSVYGTTKIGGGGSNCDGGCGVVFKLDKTRTETVLYGFTGGADGSLPSAGMIRDSAGNLYGTAGSGGASGAGVVFKLDTTGETVLYSFIGGAAGASPGGGLTRDSAGNLFGTTAGGAECPGCGVVFMLQP
jgi:uncharacterized repeat protein (TIGR03803 family)